MISYHPLQNGGAHGYAHGFRLAETDDLVRIARGITRYAWSPIVWDGGHRRQDRFLRADLCVLDFDSPEMSLDEALNVFCDMAHVIGTTRNHQREKHGITCDRFRVVLRFARPISRLASYLYSLQRVVARYPADAAAKDGARFFFPCREIVSVATDGYTEAVLEAPSADEIARAARARWRRVDYLEHGRKPRWLDDFLTTGRVIGSGRNHTVYCAAMKLAELGEDPDRIAELIAAAPFDRHEMADTEIYRTVNSALRRFHG